MPMPSGCRQSAGQSRHRGPYCSASTHQTANWHSEAGWSSYQRSNSSRRGARPPDRLEDGALDPPDGIAVDLPALVEGASGRRRSLERVARLRRAGDVLDPQVQRVPIAAAGGKVGARLLGVRRGDRAHRVDEHETGPQSARPPRQPGEVTEIADPPALRRAGRVQLGSPSPVTPTGRQVTAARTDDHTRRAALAVGERVVPQRDIAGRLVAHGDGRAVFEDQLTRAEDDAFAGSEHERRATDGRLADDATQPSRRSRPRSVADVRSRRRRTDRCPTGQTSRPLAIRQVVLITPGSQARLPGMDRMTNVARSGIGQGCQLPGPIPVARRPSPWGLGSSGGVKIGRRRVIPRLAAVQTSITYDSQQFSVSPVRAMHADAMI